MRKTFFILILTACLFNFSSINAQNKVRFGLQTGIVFTKAGVSSDNKDAQNLSDNLRFLITNATNLYVNVPLQNRFSISFEPGYTQKATDLNSALTYIQLPLLAEYNPVDKLYIQAGPEFNFLLNNDGNNSYKGFHTALQAGLYYGVSYSFDLGFKYSIDTSNFLKEDITLTNEFGMEDGKINFYHNYFQFYTRYKF